MSARIGLFAVGLEAYWNQFEGLKNALLSYHNSLGAKFAGYDVVDVGLVDNVQRAQEAGLRFKAEDIDIVFCHLATYSSSEALLPVVQQIPNATIVLVNAQPVVALDVDNTKTIDSWLKVCTCAGLSEMTAVMRRIGQKFAVVSGYLEGDRLLDDELEQWCRAARTVRRLKSGNIGLLGRPYGGMMDLNVDETRIFQTFGTYVKHLNWEQLVTSISNGYEDVDLELAIKQIQGVFTLPEDLDTRSIVSIAQVLLAVEDLVAQNELIGLANHCEVQPIGLMQQVISTSNPVLSMLTKRGIVCPAEADIKVAIAMIILKTIGGSATLAEFYSMDFKRDYCLVGHSGAGDPDISDKKSELKFSPVFHGKAGSGYLTQFHPALGPVTVLAVTQDDTGGYRFVVAEAEVVAGNVLQLGDTNCWVKFDNGVRSFVNSWASHGPTHHAALGRGHHATIVQKVGQLFNIHVDQI